MIACRVRRADPRPTEPSRPRTGARRTPLALAGLLVACLVGLAPGAARAAAPKGWYYSGSDTSAYELVVDHEVAHGGRSSARLSSIRPPQGTAAMSQAFDARPYLGKRVRMWAWLRTRDVEGRATAFMRVDSTDYRTIQAFDNMSFRAIRGTTEWTRHSLVLDVPASAGRIAFGLMLAGEGTVWFDDVRFEIVGPAVETTDLWPYLRPFVPKSGK